MQVLVLPPVQGCGYGKALIQAAYFLARQRAAVDLTVSQLLTVAQDRAGRQRAAQATLYPARVCAALLQRQQQA